MAYMHFGPYTKSFRKDAWLFVQAPYDDRRYGDVDIHHADREAAYEKIFNIITNKLGN